MAEWLTFKKLPVEVAAVRYTADDPGLREQLNNLGIVFRRSEKRDGSIEVWNKLEGCWVRCPIGHWIIRGTKQEFYPCEDDNGRPLNYEAGGA